MTYLNVYVLFAWIWNEEGEGVLPYRIAGPIASLRRERDRGMWVTCIFGGSSATCTVEYMTQHKNVNPHSALFGCVLNGDLNHGAGVLVAFLQLQHIQYTELTRILSSSH